MYAYFPTASPVFLVNVSVICSFTSVVIVFVRTSGAAYFFVMLPFVALTITSRAVIVSTFVSSVANVDAESAVVPDTVIE